MSNFAFGLPNHGAIFRFSFRDDLGAWPADQLMDGGAGSPSDTFASPVCDELRLTATFTDAAAFSLVHFSSLSILEGLTFSIDGDATNLTSETITIEPLPKPKRDLTIAFTETTATTIEITITGLAQRSLTFDQVVFSRIDWQPAVNFSDETQPVNAARYERQRTRQSNRQRSSDKARIYPLFFWNVTEAEYKECDHLINTRAENGHILLLLDPDSTAAEDSYMANAQLSDFSSEGAVKQFNMNIVEANAK